MLNESKLEGAEAYRRALDETLKTYFDRYNRYWMAILQDVRARRFKSTNDGADVIANLEGPLRSIYVEVARQTMLSAVETLPASDRVYLRDTLEAAKEEQGKAAEEK